VYKRTWLAGDLTEVFWVMGVAQVTMGHTKSWSSMTWMWKI
jgi:hypothetical protein